MCQCKRIVFACYSIWKRRIVHVRSDILGYTCKHLVTTVFFSSFRLMVHYMVHWFTVFMGIPPQKHDSSGCIFCLIPMPGWFDALLSSLTWNTNPGRRRFGSLIRAWRELLVGVSRYEWIRNNSWLERGVWRSYGLSMFMCIHWNHVMYFSMQCAYIFTYKDI